MGGTDKLTWSIIIKWKFFLLVYCWKRFSDIFSCGRQCHHFKSCFFVTVARRMYIKLILYYVYYEFYKREYICIYQKTFIMAWQTLSGASHRYLWHSVTDAYTNIKCIIYHHTHLWSCDILNVLILVSSHMACMYNNKQFSF